MGNNGENAAKNNNVMESEENMHSLENTESLNDTFSHENEAPKSEDETTAGAQFPSPVSSTSGNLAMRRPISGRRPRVEYKSLAELSIARDENRLAKVQTRYGTVLFMSYQPLKGKIPDANSISDDTLQSVLRERERLLQARNLSQRLNTLKLEANKSHL